MEWWIIRSHCCKYARAAHCRDRINTTERGVSRAHLWFFTFFFYYLDRCDRLEREREREREENNPFISGGFKSDQIAR